MDFTILIYIALGLAPSLIWLSFYLREDIHPEPKKMILKIFLWGGLITIPVFFVQIGLGNLLALFGLSKIIYNILYWFVVISFTEELFKYLVVRLKIFGSPSLDEPLDLMLYMVIAALGFAAVENILYILSATGNDPFNLAINKALITIAIRFVGATFLHTLCSAVIGYSLAVYLKKIHNKIYIVILGIFAALFMHGFFNYSLMAFKDSLQFIVPIIVVITLAFFVFVKFSKLQKMKGISDIK